MTEYGFEENVDFNPYQTVQVQIEGDREVKREIRDYQITIDVVLMDWEFMKHVTDTQIQKEIDARMAQDAIREKKHQEKQDKHDAAILITAFIVCTIVIGLLGG